MIDFIEFDDKKVIRNQSKSPINAQKRMSLNNLDVNASKNRNRSVFEKKRKNTGLKTEANEEVSSVL